MTLSILVTGGTGTVGAAILSSLAGAPFRVYATTRNPNCQFPDGVKGVAVDLLDRSATERALTDIGPIDVLIYSALYATSPDRGHEAPQIRRQLRSTRRLLGGLGWVPGLRAAVHKAAAKAANAWSPGNENPRMFDNVLSVLEANHELQHVGLVTGGKAYGMHLSPHLYAQWQSVMREDQPRAPGPNFYFDQEDRLAAGAAKHGYGTLVSRPSYVVGHSTSGSYNLLNTLCVYATLLREEGRALEFPGNELNAKTVFSWCDADLVGQLHRWGIEEQSGAHHVLNISNGDPLSLETVWDVIAEALDMQSEFPAEQPRVGAYLRAGGQRWPAIVDKHGLAPTPFHRLTSPDQLTGLAAHDWDTRYDLSRLRKAGFNRRVDSREMFSRWVGIMRRARVIP